MSVQCWSDVFKKWGLQSCEDWFIGHKYQSKSESCSESFCWSFFNRSLCKTVLISVISHCWICWILVQAGEMTVWSTQDPHKFHEPPLFTLHSPFPLLRETKEKFASFPQGIVWIMPSRWRQDLYMVWTPTAVKSSPEWDDVRKDEFYVSVTQLGSGNGLHLLNEYQLTLWKLGALVMNSQALKGQIFPFVFQNTGSPSNKCRLVQNVCLK